MRKEEKTTAKALVDLLKDYRIGMSYEPLVDVMRDLAVGMSETYMFEDGSSITLEEDERDENGFYQTIRVHTDTIVLENDPDDKPKPKRKKKEGKGE